ncbi:acetate--CoA ligase [Candidatus Parcubacteria bacterium]|nr:acetate--CoA ligase [Candidatus Parcubacteria bacterium]
MFKKVDLYYPTKEIKNKAWVKDKKIYKDAERNPIKFWEDLAKEIFWFKKWKKTFVHKPPSFQWFVEGKINITSNIFEKNSLGWEKIKNKTALIWEPEPTNEKERKLTYDELFREVNKFANALKRLGVRKGDRVGIYLPMIPEVIISMLACARIGAIHSVVFSAFSSSALKIRLQDTEAKVLITADGYWRRGKIIDLKKNADEGIKQTKVKKVIVVQRAKNEISWQKNKDFWWQDLIEKESVQCEPRIMDSEDTLFILYTSGSTGKPKGTVHTCGGYTVQAKWTGKWIFDLHHDDIMWCTADVGWVTGHTYGVYSPLLNGIPTLIYEGSPDWPAPDRWAKIIEKHKVTIFYTAPTAIRMFKKYGTEFIKKYKFNSLRILGSVGEPIDEAAWNWYFKKVGKGKCPILDTWWQTETGGILITSLPGIGPFKPCFTGLPLPGLKFDILDEKGKSLPPNKEGNLVLLPPFSPGLLRGIYKNPKKYLETYWSEYGKKVYFTSDAAYKNKQGLIRIVGRVDDVIKVAGHRFTTGELENAISKLSSVSECAVIGIPDEIKGETPIVFVVLKKEKSIEETKKELIGQLRKEIGPIASPKQVYLVEDLPKTRSGKIMRRILKRLLAKEKLGDLSTLANPESIKDIKKVVKVR